MSIFVNGKKVGLMFSSSDSAPMIDTYTRGEIDIFLSAKVDSTDSRLSNARTPLAHTHNPTDINQNSNSRFVSDVEKNTWNNKATLSDIAGHNTSTYSHSDIREELDETRAIAEGGKRAYTFDTEQAMLDWLAVPANVAILTVGDNLYIVDLAVPDYWWTGTEPKPLGTEKVDFTNYYTKPQTDGLLATKVNNSDSRLTDARTPLTHTHGNSDLTGLASWAKAANKPTYTAAEVGATTSSQVAGMIESAIGQVLAGGY